MCVSTSYSYRDKSKRPKVKAKQKVVQNSIPDGGVVLDVGDGGAVLDVDDGGAVLDVADELWFVG